LRLATLLAIVHHCKLLCVAAIGRFHLAAAEGSKRSRMLRRFGERV
jgi:hypothetical protein